MTELPVRLYYGSLEHSIRPGGRSGDRPSTPPETEFLPFSEKALEAQQKHQKQLEEFEQRKKAKNLALPTDDKLVQARLRELGEPIILFGELPPERRDRLRDILLRRGIDDAMPTSSVAPRGQQMEQDEIFYTEGTQALRNARVWIAKWSLPRARDRLIQAKKKREMDESNIEFITKESDRLSNLFSKFRGFSLIASQVGDERPLSWVSFLPDSERVVISSWNGICKLWHAEKSECLQTFIGHNDRASCIVPHPQATNTQSESVVNLASGGVDCNVCLWALDKGSPLATLKGHQHRVNRVAFHPSGRFLGSASTDLTWRLWDVETGKDVLEQEGHSRSVFAIAFQNDGSVVSTGGQDCISRVWDLRSGKSIHVFRGHCKQVLGLDWSPNGYQMASCSEDDTVKIWDLRKRRLLYTVAAHRSTVCTVKYHEAGDIFTTASFDNTVKFWNAADWSLIKEVRGNEGKIMAADVAPNFSKIVTANYDRTWRLFMNTGVIDNSAPSYQPMVIDESNNTNGMEEDSDQDEDSSDEDNQGNGKEMQQ